MTTGRRGHPVAVCTQCGRYEYQVLTINERCSAHINKRQCKGASSSALDLGDWQQCADCLATGLRNGSECSICNGTGWHYLRPRVGIFR